MRQVTALTDRIQREIGEAAATVAAMPAGGGPFVDGLVQDVTERAALVGLNAARDDDDNEGEGPIARDEAFPASSL